MDEQYLDVWTRMFVVTGNDDYIIKRICKGIGKYENDKEEDFN